MKFRCEIDMNNAAFESLPGRELGIILQKVAKDVESYGDLIYFSNTLRDSNGNTVGFIEVTEDIYDLDDKL